MTRPVRLLRPGVLLVVVCATLAIAATAGAVPTNVKVKILSLDPYTNTSSFHKTEVEPDSFSFDSTIVTTFQVGRFVDGGASNNGWSTTTDAGRTWTRGFLPGTTTFSDPPGPWDRTTDPAVAYDAAHGVWMINSLAMDGTTGAAIIVNRSTDGALTFDEPVVVDAIGGGQFFDKNWIGCDSTPSSPYYGHCYVQWDDFFAGNALHISTSTDGGLTWTEADVPNASVIGGNPMVQPSGKVVVPIEDGFESEVNSFVSTNGGVSFTGPFQAADITSHGVAGNLRAHTLLTGEMDGSGKIFVAWHDCRFRTGCSANDIVMTTSTNGTTWTNVVRIPIDPTNSGVDHFLPGLGVDIETAGGSAHLGLAYYFYPDSSCTESTCELSVGFVSSPDGGTSWSLPTQLSGPMNVTSLPLTSQGYMVGDYISTSFAEGKAHPVYVLARSGSCDLGQITSCLVTAVTPRRGLGVVGPLVRVAEDPVVFDRPVERQSPAGSTAV